MIVAASVLALSAFAAGAPVVIIDGERAPDAVTNSLDIRCGGDTYRLEAVNSYAATPGFAIVDGEAAASPAEIAKITREAEGFFSAGFTQVRCLPSGGFVARVHLRMRPDRDPGAKSFNIAWSRDRTIWIGTVEDHPTGF